MNFKFNWLSYTFICQIGQSYSMGVWALPAPWATWDTGVHSPYIFQEDDGQDITGQCLFWSLSQAPCE